MSKQGEEVRTRIEEEGVPAAQQAIRHATPGVVQACLLYTSDAADERSSVDLGGRRIIKKKNIK